MDVNDNEELKRVMGGRMKDALPVLPGQEFKPSKAKMPEKPKGGTPAPFPIISPDKLTQYLEEKAKAEEPFAANKTRTFDPELNEFALQEVAQERGITVEELLRQQGKKLETKVQPMDTQKTQEEQIDLELEDLALRRKELDLKRQRMLTEILPVSTLEVSAPKPTPYKKMKEVNPVLKKMREKLSMDRIKPVEVIIEDVRFELLPPPSSVYPWVLNKLQEVAEGGQEAVKLMLRICTAATGIVRVEGVPIAEVLELISPDSLKDPLNPPAEIRVMTAQALLEMYQGSSTLENLFPFNPVLADKLATAFDTSFKNITLKSSFDPKMRKYTCPVETCQEVYDEAREKGVLVFCQVHGAPMDDRGLTSEVDALPLP